MLDVSQQIERIAACGVVPVVTLPSVQTAVPLAKALLAGGLDVMEVTLRSECALDGITEITDAGLDVLVGAGTILQPRDISAAEAAKADFLVTPGSAKPTLDALKSFEGLAFPGVSTVSEALARQNDGFDYMKFFPAEASGGVSFLKSIGAPIPNIKFMPTGGVSADNLADYLKLENVVAAGGSWIAPLDLVQTGNWLEIENRARSAAQIVKLAHAAIISA